MNAEYPTWNAGDRVAAEAVVCLRLRLPFEWIERGVGDDGFEDHLISSSLRDSRDHALKRLIVAASGDVVQGIEHDWTDYADDYAKLLVGNIEDQFEQAHWSELVTGIAQAVVAECGTEIRRVAACVDGAVAGRWSAQQIAQIANGDGVAVR